MTKENSILLSSLTRQVYTISMKLHVEFGKFNIWYMKKIKLDLKIGFIRKGKFGW